MVRIHPPPPLFVRLASGLKFQRVWFNGRTSAFQADGAGSIPATRSSLGRLVKEIFGAHVAQSVEHFLGKEEVTGSNPVMSSIKIWRQKLIWSAFVFL